MQSFLFNLLFFYHNSPGNTNLTSCLTFKPEGEVMRPGKRHSLINVAVNFFISGIFYFSLVSYSLAYIAIPQNNGKIQINGDKRLTTT